MTEGKNKKCTGSPYCDRDVLYDDRCAFHLPIDHELALSPDEYDKLLIKEINEAEENKNGLFTLKWHGFNFPKDHFLFNTIKYESVRGRLARSWINIQDSNIQNILIETLSIDTLILSRAIIHGETMIGVTQINSFRMPNAKIRGRFHCASKSYDFNAIRAVFDGEFSFASSIKVMARFMGCHFNNSCSFNGSGARNVFGDKENSEFKLVGFDNAIFGKPTQTIFQDVDLSKASFKSVSLVGVRFYNTNFYQKELKRNGLYNEVRRLERDGYKECKWACNEEPDDNTKKRMKHIIHECRQLRMAMESNKDYVKANDFYIGEMQARQRRKCSAILKLYHLSSFYGTNYVKAFWWLLTLFVIHIILTILFSTNWQIQKLFYGSDIISAWGRLGDIVIHSLNTGTLQRIGLLKDVSFYQNIVDILFRIVIPIQTAMFVLALRNKTKR